MTNLLRGYTETFDGCGAFNESQLLRQTVPTREACQIQRRKKFRRRTTTTKKKLGAEKTRVDHQSPGAGLGVSRVLVLLHDANN